MCVGSQFNLEVDYRTGYDTSGCCVALSLAYTMANFMSRGTECIWGFIAIVGRSETATVMDSQKSDCKKGVCGQPALSLGPNVGYSFNMSEILQQGTPHLIHLMHPMWR